MPPSLSRVGRHRFFSVALAGALACASFASAHDGLAERIAGVTAQLAGHPAGFDLLVRRAELYRVARRWKEALADLDRAERVDPTLPTPDLVRAHLFLDAHNWAAAIDRSSRYLARQPGNADALIVRGRAHARLGRARAAAADFTLALERQPLPDVYTERARALEGLGQAGLEDALHGLDEGIARLGPILTLELEAIDLELRLNRYDAALARLDRLSTQASRKDSWLARRGAVLERAGRRDEARAAYGAALDSASAQPEHIRTTRASVALVERLRADIARLDSKVTSKAASNITNNVTTASHGLKRNR